MRSRVVGGKALVRGLGVGLVILAQGVVPLGASVVFENSGTSTGWSQLYVENQGSVTSVSSPAYAGTTSMRCRQIYTSGYGGRYHSEGRQEGSAGQQRGNDEYYGFAWYLPSNWQFVDQKYNVQQFIANFTELGCSGGQPTTQMKLRNRLLDVRLAWGDPCARELAYYTVAPSVTPGVWHRVVMHGRWRSDNTGAFQAWYDGSQTVNLSNLPTIPPTDKNYTFVVGLYADGWHDDGTMVGTQSTRDMFFDNIRVATTYGETDPASWGGSTPTPTPPPSGFSGYYRVTARHSGKAMVVQGASSADGADIVQYTYGGSNTNDEWELRSIGSGYYRVINRLSGKDMVVQSASTAEGADIIQYTYGGSSTNDEWAIVSVGSGYYRLTNRLSGKSAEVVGGGTGDGADIVQRTYSGATYQQFQLVSIP